jgi:plastocyanin
MKRLMLITLLLPIAAFGAGLLLVSLLFPSVALAADDDFALVIKDHQFQPKEITVPAGKKIKLRIENQDATPEEFESYELNREKVIAGNGKATIYIGPLDAGRYPFFGEFHKDSAQGVIVAK